MSHKQHFFLSANARTLSVRNVFEMSNDKAFALFREVRCGNGDEVVFPIWGVIEKHYFKPTRKQWQRKDCKGSSFCADESNAYDPLHAKFDTRLINHSIEYRIDDSITNNLAKSYFTRFSLMQYGQVDKFGIYIWQTMPTKQLI